MNGPLTTEETYHISNILKHYDHAKEKHPYFCDKPRADATLTADGFGLNVGTMAAAIIAAAGTTLCNPAGRISCETDYLAISGATFPADVPREELEAFNRRTLRDVMSEADERSRYAAIADFWRYGHV